MKIQKLHIYNIASIVDATIDFTAQPLCDSDVYLITGDTGAGKTTILDAICLALFNNTPRLAKGKSVRVKNGIDDLTLNDPRRLMRRNTGEAMVELFFEVNGTEYKAEWQLQRGKKKKADVAANAINRSFENLTTNETIQSVGTKDAELQAKIEEVIGLDFDQFCRTTMLAQNEFTKFLASDENDRSAILEKITKTTDFSAAGKKIFEITSQKKDEWEKATQKASDTGLTEEQISEKKAQLGSLETELKQKKVEREDARKKRDWITRESELVNNEVKAQRDFDEARKQLESDEYKRDCLIVDQWNKTIDARKWLEQRQTAESKIKGYHKDLSDLKEKFMSVLAGINFNQNQLQVLKAEQETIEQYFKENSAKTDTFEQAQSIVTHLKTIVDKTEKIQRLEQDIQREEKNRDEKLIPTSGEAKKVFDAENTKMTELQKQIELKDKEYQELNLSSLRGERDTQKDLLRNIDDAIKDVNAIGKAEDSMSNEKQRLEKLKQAIDAKEKDFQDRILPEYEKAKAKKDASEKAKDLLCDSVDSFAKQMRTHLSIGCECPVCRQKVVELPLEEELDKIYQAAESNYQTDKESFENAETEKNRVEADIKSEKNRYEEDKSKYDNDHSISDAKAKAIESCKKCGINELTEDISTKLETLKSEKETYLMEQLEPKINKGDAIEEELRALRKQQTDQSNICDDKRKEFDKAEKKVNECNTKIQGFQNSIQENKRDIETADNSIRPLIADTQWQYDWTKEPDLFKADLEKSSKEYAGNKSRKSQLEQTIVPLQDTNEKVGNIVRQIKETVSDWHELTTEDVRQQEDLFNLASDVQQQTLSITTSLKKESETSCDSVEKMAIFFQKHPEINKDRLEELNQFTSITDLSSKLESQRQEPGNKEALLKNAKEEHETHQGSKPALSEDDTLERLYSAYTNAEQKINGLNQSIGAISGELKADVEKKKGLEELIKQANQAQAEYQKWQRLNRLFGDKEGKTFRTIAQSYIFENLLHSANAYLQKLEPRYTLRTVEGTLYASLEDAYQGFASRDTSSLSGGESFLVSLALALALSDIGQGLTVDTLFIDEGFGSLSGQPLANAINTLRSLRGKNGRHVGIISHIQEVRDNIPVQIQVNKTSNNSSSTIQVVQ